MWCQMCDAASHRDEAVDGAWTSLETALADVDKLIEDGMVGQMPCEVVQRLVTVATRLYCARREVAEERVAPFLTRDGTPLVTATEAVTMASAALRALDIETFELAMWQALDPSA